MGVASAGAAAEEAKALVELPSGPGFRMLSFEPTDEIIENPERGLYSRVNLLADERADYSNLTPLLHTYVRLDQYRDADIDESLLSAIEAGLTRVRSAGKKVILRFSYNFGPYPDCEPDASEDRILAHVEQLAPLLARSSDVVAWFEAGFIGCWGEWHSSTHHLDSSPDAKVRIVQAILSHWPALPVQVRYPNDLRLLRTRIPTPERDRVGFHNDCVFASEPDDFGTWGRGGGSVSGDKHLVQQVAQVAPVGGETCNISSRSTCETALSELAAQGWTDLNGGFKAEVLQLFADEGCMDAIRDKLGYRFRLLRASLPKRIDPHQPIELGLELVNEGWARPYNQRPLLVVLDADGTRIALETQLDVRELRPGQSEVFRLSLALPDSVAEGTYRLGVWLPDREPSLRDDSRYAIHFANRDVWDAAGVNWIAQQVVAGTEGLEDAATAQGGAAGASPETSARAGDASAGSD